MAILLFFSKSQRSQSRCVRRGRLSRVVRVCVCEQYRLFGVVDNAIRLMTAVIVVGERTGLFVAELVKEWLNMHLPSPEILIKKKRCQVPTSQFPLHTHSGTWTQCSYTHTRIFDTRFFFCSPIAKIQILCPQFFGNKVKHFSLHRLPRYTQRHTKQQESKLKCLNFQLKTGATANAIGFIIISYFQRLPSNVR